MSMAACFRERQTWCAGIATIAILVACSGTAWAQTPTRIAWTQAGAAKDLRFFIFVDGARAALANVTCVAGATSSECSGALPTIQPGSHTIALSAVDPF